MLVEASFSPSPKIPEILQHIAFAGCIEKLFVFDVVFGGTKIAAGHLEEPSDNVSKLRICEHEASVVERHYIGLSGAVLRYLQVLQSHRSTPICKVVSSTLGSNH